MAKSNATRQKAYRRRLALAKVRNEFIVALMLEQCEIAGIDIWPVVEDCANVVFSNKGDGLQFVRNVAPLVFAVVSTYNLTPRQPCRPGV